MDTIEVSGTAARRSKAIRRARPAAVVLILSLAVAACASDETLSGAEAQEYLRERLGAAAGSDLDPSTFACPLDERIGPGESMVCLARSTSDAVYEFELRAHKVDGELKLVVDVL